MSRRLLALLAILSGLAALHAPANASQLERLSYDIESLSELSGPQSGAACQGQCPPKKRKLACAEPGKNVHRPRFLSIQSPSVIVGSDFALE